MFAINHKPPVDVEYLPTDGCRLVWHAQEFANSAHSGQSRLSGEPFIEHPLAVAKILYELRPDSPTLAAAMLHDVIEDTPTTLREIRTCFGAEVAFLVDGLTKVVSFDDLDDAWNSDQVEARCLANFAKLTQAIKSDPRIAFIRLADRLHNMRTLSALPQMKRRRIARETLAFHVPLAHYFGILSFGSELRLLAYAHLDIAQSEPHTSRLII